MTRVRYARARARVCVCAGEGRVWEGVGGRICAYREVLDVHLRLLDDVRQRPSLLVHRGTAESVGQVAISCTGHTKQTQGARQ